MKGEILSEEWGGNRSHGPSPELGARLPASAPAEVWAATQTGADHIHIFRFFNFMSLLVLRLRFLGQVGERRAGQPHSSVPAEGNHGRNWSYLGDKTLTQQLLALLGTWSSEVLETHTDTFTKNLDRTVHPP